MKMKRVWHKDLIPVLPRKVLMRQWRECCVIARNKVTAGSVGSARMRRIEDYPKAHFGRYALDVAKECEARGIPVDRMQFFRWFDQWKDDSSVGSSLVDIDKDDVFSGWHNDRYMFQCWYDLQEMFDCGEITKEDWLRVCDSVGRRDEEVVAG